MGRDRGEVAGWARWRRMERRVSLCLCDGQRRGARRRLPKEKKRRGSIGWLVLLPDPRNGTELATADVNGAQ